MSARSTAGVGLDPLRWLPQLREDDEVSPPVYCAAAGLAGHFDPRTGVAGAPVPAIAHLVGQHPDRTRQHLRLLGQLGWTDVVRPAGRGRGRFALYALAQPSLIAGNTLPGGHFSRTETPSQEGVSSPENTLPGGLFRPETPSQEGVFSVGSPLTARAGCTGTGTGTGRAAQARLRRFGLAALADPVVVGTYERLLELGLRALGNEQRDLLAGVIAGRLAEGWTPDELVHRIDLELDRSTAHKVRAPGQFVLTRTEHLPARLQAVEDTARRAEAWREEVAGGPDPERLRAGTASLRAAMRGAS